MALVRQAIIDLEEVIVTGRVVFDLDGGKEELDPLPRPHLDAPVAVAVVRVVAGVSWGLDRPVLLTLDIVATHRISGIPGEVEAIASD